MERIIIIGSGGAGKSTLARRLHEITGIKLLHLDTLYWGAGWVEPSVEEWQSDVEKMIAEESWIMDGNFGGTLEMRLAACDTAIFLDLPPIVCLYRVVKRRLKYRGRNRPDMTEGCNEKIDLDFLAWVLSYRRKKLPKVERLLQRFENDKTIVRLRSQTEVEVFFRDLGRCRVL